MHFNKLEKKHKKWNAGINILKKYLENGDTSSEKTA
jgi:hypothetical protein